ncbi:4'-phosphopantetheinyl transferase family protein [Wenzhouxiangella marina]|uniref:Uncharacterized protein n=1 Tax=Wenzhouxiangella marina TaxID=1579979 RepID=A0A0K0XYF9_9GAMM|nr:4'-phosphopantetheinyl transferase superfamily protein [Wenzhouxiangella marina]AKS42718.1 hypothetical protein WM2015_2355 [Wenzhouxiangella marina]MBB6088593.1 4'-phosphopantetheinyl transferase [Wenzhouxiangella marina]
MRRWQSVPLPLRRRALPRAGQVHLWLTDLDELPLEAGPSGLTRKERVLKRRIQQRFVLRLLLGSYLGLPGKDVQVIQSDRNDKPRLGGVHEDSGLSFNVSHSDRWLAIGLVRDQEVGVDIEAEREMRRAGDLARRYFSGPDCERIDQLDEPERSSCFLNQWTAREALVKAVGCGLAGSLGKIELDCEPTEIRQLPEDWPQAWQLLKPDWPAGLLGHLAIPTGQDLDLSCYWLQTSKG